MRLEKVSNDKTLQYMTLGQRAFMAGGEVGMSKVVVVKGAGNNLFRMSKYI
jgi:hypothetical protein